MKVSNDCQKQIIRFSVLFISNKVPLSKVLQISFLIFLFKKVCPVLIQLMSGFKTFIHFIIQATFTENGN
jgi:hypothetical protein